MDTTAASSKATQPTAAVNVTERVVSHAAYRAGRPNNLAEAGTMRFTLDELSGWFRGRVAAYSRFALTEKDHTTFVVDFYNQADTLAYQLEVSCQEADHQVVHELLTS